MPMVPDSGLHGLTFSAHAKLRSVTNKIAEELRSGSNHNETPPRGPVEVVPGFVNDFTTEEHVLPAHRFLVVSIA